MANWIWYPGDLELYYALVQNSSRVERGCGWPAFWKSESFRHRVAFRRTYRLEQETTFRAYSQAVGFVDAEDRRYPFGAPVTCGPGEVTVSIHTCRIDAFPSVYIEGDVICSDGSWTAEDYAAPPVPVGTSRYFTRREQEPSVWEFSEKNYIPVSAEAVNGGALFEFETELTAVLTVKTKADRGPVLVCCGESRAEALDPDHCYYSWTPDGNGNCPRCAVRYAFIPGYGPEEIVVTGVHQFVDIASVTSFHSGDPLLDRIWSVAEHTFQLCSGVFFIDGIKRDKWLWSGDAYQSILTNQILTRDADIERRTLLALRGNDPMTTHINTIVDYTLLWVLGIKAHLDAYGDMEFLWQVWPKVLSLMEFIEGQLDEHGFLVGRPGDWIFIDWADFDKDGPFCPEQMLLDQCYGAMESLAAVMSQDPSPWQEKRRLLEERIEEHFWDGEKSAYIDSFTSGKRNVTRHGNIFAILFGIADETRKRLILDKVLHNESVPAITTPYFKFFELEALCQMGCRDEVLDTIKAYWGGMLERGAATFWEEFDPGVSGDEQYDMYGDKFGKSLCHAWGASPIYLLKKYFSDLET